MQSTLRVSTASSLAAIDMTEPSSCGHLKTNPTNPTSPTSLVGQSACAMSRYTANSTSASSDASSMALKTPNHSSTCANYRSVAEAEEHYEEQQEQEPELSKSRPGSFGSIESLTVVTPDLALASTIHLPDTFTDEQCTIEARSTSPNSIITLKPGEATPRAGTPKSPTTVAAVSPAPPLTVVPTANTFDYNASEFVGPKYGARSSPDPAASPVTVLSSSGTSRVLGHDASTGVTIIDYSENISMPRSTPSSRSSSSTSIASSSGSSRSTSASIENPPNWAQGSTSCSSVDGTYEELMRNRQEVEKEFGDEMFQHRDDEGAQSAVKSVSGRIVVKTDPKRYISAVWLPGLSRDNIMIHCTSDCLNIQANSHERDEHFYWRIRLPGADLDITCASMVGESLRVSVMKQTSSAVVRRHVLAEVGIRAVEADCVPAIREATDCKGDRRTEKEMFEP